MNAAERVRSFAASLAGRWWAFPVATFLVTRAALVGISYWAMRLTPRLQYPRGYPGDFLKPYPLIDGFCRWDCGWYEKIATEGYKQLIETAFWPGFPMAARGLHLVTGLHIQFCLIILANLFALVAYLAIYRVFEKVEGEAAARWGLILFCAYPFAFYQSAGYAESMMIAGTAVAVLLAMNGRHLWAGLALAVAVSVRHLAILAGATLLGEQIRARGLHPKKFFGSVDWLGLLVPFLPYALFMWYCKQHFGDAMATWHARAKGWGGDKTSYGVLDLFRHHVKEPRYYLYAAMSLIPGLGAAFLLAKRAWLTLAPFAILLLLTVWTIAVMGLGRHSASVWPAFLPLGVFVAKRPSWQTGTVVALALFQGMFFYLFVNHYGMT